MRVDAYQCNMCEKVYAEGHGITNFMLDEDGYICRALCDDNGDRHLCGNCIFTIHDVYLKSSKSVKV